MKYSGAILLLVMLSIGLTAQTVIEPSAGDGSQDNPYEIASLENLYWITASECYVPDPDQETRWSSHYIQTADIDASDTINWFEEQGWNPIGYWITSLDNRPFTGSYNGENHSIDAIYINRPNNDGVGLFGNVEGATIENLGLTNIDITGNNTVGSLVGAQHATTIINCYSTGSINGTGYVGYVGGLVGGQLDNSHIVDSYSSVSVGGTGYLEFVGGLVGGQSGSVINNSYSSGSVDGDSQVGGLVGTQVNSTINDSYSTGSVNGYSQVGGLAGNQFSSTISNSYSSGIVTGTESAVGGLVGMQSNSTITNSYSTVDASGEAGVGGLLGYQSNNSTVSKSNSTGSVNGVEIIGGLVGVQESNCTISDSYSTGSVNGNSQVGGLVGIQVSSIINDSYSTGSVSGQSWVGGLIGAQSDSSTFSSYWDMETSGQTSSVGGEGRNTDEMTYPYGTATFVDWDFNDIWAEDVDYDINNGYPYLTDVTLSLEDDVIEVVESLTLTNYPNPFNPETTIKFRISVPGNVELTVYNIKGERISKLLKEFKEAGEHSIVWDGKNDLGQPVSSGVYFYRMITPEYDRVNKMLLLK